MQLLQHRSAGEFARLILMKMFIVHYNITHYEFSQSHINEIVLINTSSKTALMVVSLLRHQKCHQRSHRIPAMCNSLDGKSLSLVLVEEVQMGQTRYDVVVE